MFPDAKILEIDLSNKTYEVKSLSGDIYRKYPGGSALGMYLLLKHMKPGIDPLSPENLLIFSVSPFTGFPISGQSRMTVTAKSPLTGTAGDSQVGGDIPVHVKSNGYDSIMFKGKADTPVYVYIDKEQVQIRDATHLWGKVTGEVESLIRKELDQDQVEMSVIGQAGENLVLYASIIHQLNRANGRNGIGAVMGSKNLKALVIKQQKTSKPYSMSALKTLTVDVKTRIEKNPVIVDLAVNGTAGVTDFHLQEGFLPTENWKRGYLDGGEPIKAATMTKTILKDTDTCFGCAIRCKRVVEVEGKVFPQYGGPEYETVSTFGSYSNVTNLKDIALANQLCNMYGLDTISCGATIAFAMECYEAGLLTNEDTDGLELKFGNSSIYETLIPKIANREEGIGAILAEGSARAAEKIGKGAEKFVMAVKKQEMPAHMPQMKPNLAINYAVNPFGADHQSSEHDPALMAPKDSQDWIWVNKLAKFQEVNSYGVLDENKAKFAFETQKFYSMMDSISLCQFVWGPAWQLYGPDELLNFLKYSLNWDTNIEELQEIGERRINMMRYFNALEGFTRKEDKIPDRIFEPIPDGPNAGTKITKGDFEDALDKYYEFAGWDIETGNPTNETLKRLGLEWLVN